MVTTEPTARDGRIATRIAALRFVPVLLAIGAFVWVAVRLAVPYQVVVEVADQIGRPVSGAEVSFRSLDRRPRQTGDDGRCALWVRRDEAKYDSALIVSVPDLGISQTQGWSWRRVRRGERVIVTLTLGDTVAGTVTSATSLARLNGARASATFVLADGTEHTESNLTGQPSYYAGQPVYVQPNVYESRSGEHGGFFVTRKLTGPGSAVSVQLTVWAPGHAPRTQVLQPSRVARGHAFFDAGNVPLMEWATAAGQTSTLSSGRPVSQHALVRAVVWSEAAASLPDIQGDPTLEGTGSDDGGRYAILRSTQQWSTSFDVTLPIPATRVVLVATANDRPPAVVEVDAEAVAALQPGRRLAGYPNLDLPPPNPLTLTFKTTEGAAVSFARVSFARVLAGSRAAVSIGAAPVTTNAQGKLTIPILEDGETYRIKVQLRTGTVIEFEKVIEPRAEIVVPNED